MWNICSEETTTKESKNMGGEKMKEFGKKVLFWLIGIAVFVVSVDVIVWLFEKFIFDKSYSFSFKWSILIPIIFYFVLTVVYWFWKRRKQKK